MKKLMYFAALMLLAATSASAQKQKKGDAATPVAAVAYPYSPTYSATLLPGNAALAVVVLNAWKDYDENAIRRSESIFTDDLKIFSGSGKVLQGKEAVLTALGQFRSKFKDAATSVASWVVLRSPDHPDEQIVCIWGTETDTLPDGSTDKFNLHELWSFNSEGKVFMIRSFEQKVLKEDAH